MAKSRKLLLTALLAVVCLVASLCAVLLPTTTARATEYEYVLSEETKFPAVDSALIVHQYGGKYYAMTATNSNAALTVTEVTLTDNNTKIDTSSTTITEKMLWKIKSAGGNDVEIESPAFTSYNKLYAYNSVSLGNSASTLDGSSKYLYATNDKAVVGSSTGYTMDAWDSTKFLIFVQQEAHSSGDDSEKITGYFERELQVGATAQCLIVANTTHGNVALAVAGTSIGTATGTISVTVEGGCISEVSLNTAVWEVTRTSADKFTLKAVNGTNAGQYAKWANFWGWNGTTAFELTYIASENGDGFYISGDGTNNKVLTYSTSNKNLTSWGSKSSASLFKFYKYEEIIDPQTVSFDGGHTDATGQMGDVRASKGNYTLPACDFTRPLYKFVGWKVNGEGDTLPAGSIYDLQSNIQLVAQWEENWWNVTLKLDGQADRIEKVEKGTALALQTNEAWWADSTPNGKMFDHWTTDGTDTLTGNYTPTSDIELTAVLVDAVTISFDWNGGNAPQNLSKFKTEVKTPNSSYYLNLYTGASQTNYMPTREGYNFKGWSVQGTDTKYLIDTQDPDYPTYAQGKSVTITEDTIFVAIWGKDSYTITIVIDGASTTKTVNDGQSFTINGLRGTTSNPTKQGYLFDGWLDGANNKVEGTATITPEDDMTFTANFREPETYTFTFHWGELTATKDYTEGAFASVATSLFNELFADEIGEREIECTGWYEDAAFTTLFPVSGFTVSSAHANKHLYASVSEKYTVVFNWNYVADGADEANTISRKAVVGTPIAVPYPNEDLVTRENYRLIGWAETPDGEIKLKAEQGVTVNKACTLYAVWDYNYYVITVKLAGSDEPVGTVEVAKNRNGNTLVKINELKDSSDALVINWTAVNVEGQDATWTVIKGEDEGRDTAVNEPITLTGDITLQVRFSDHIYTITVNWVGGKLAEIKQAYNTDVTAPETEKAGYSFVAFYLNNEQGGEYTFDKMPAQDIVVWAKYEILDSTLKFDTGDGSEIADITQKTGTVVDKPADPTREGYEFVKWQIDGNDVTWLVKEGTGTTTNPEYYINMPGGETTMVAKWELTAEGLAAIKTAKLAELDAYVTEKGVDLPESYSNAISNATTEAGVNEALTAAKAKVDELKAEKDAAAQALANAKTAAKAEVAAKAAEDGVTAPSTADIDDATTIEQVNTAKAAALAAIAQAKADKDAAETAQALANAKTAAKAEVAAKAAEDGVTAPSTADIDAATTIEQVNTAKAAALAAIAQAKADKDAAEAAAQALANAKTAAKAAVEDALVEGITLAESFTQAIDNAATLEAVETAKQAALTEIERLIAAKEEAEAAQALANAKTAAKAEVAAKAAEDGVTAPSTADIDAATTIEQVNTAKAAALAAIAQAKADKDATEAAAAASKAKVDAAKAKIAALSGKKGAELFAAIKEADTAIAALTADEKAQLDMADYNAAKTAYNAYATATIADLDVAVDVGMACAAVKVATAVAALAMLTFVLKRRMW